MHLIIRTDPAARTGTVYSRSRSLGGARRILRPLESGHYLVSILGSYALGLSRSLPRWAEDVAEREALFRPPGESALLMSLAREIDNAAGRGADVPDLPELRAAAALLPCPASWIWPSPETVRVPRAV